MHKKRYDLDIIRAISKNIKPKQGRINTKGQITIFIILGLMLLLALILTVTLEKELVQVQSEEIIPSGKGRIEQLISSCMKKVGEDALFQLGLQAGYIDVPNSVANDGSMHLRISPFQVVPYWAKGLQTFIPSLSEIKNSIDLYMLENLRSCVFELEPFVETYDIVEVSGISSDTEIVNTRVIFNVRWDIEVNDKTGETISEIREHVANSPIKLKKIYDTANAVLERELLELKLEDLTQDLISMEHEKLPVVGLELSCSRKTWKVSEARQTLQDMLRVNIKKIKVEGTEYVDYPDEFPYYQNHYVWNLNEGFSQDDVSVLFNYENTYPMSFQVTPTEGGRMTSAQSGGSGLDLLSNICIQNWKFTYDVVYPVMLKVTDETTGYTFQTAFTVHLIRNRPNRAQEIMPRPGGNLPSRIDPDFCEAGTVPMTVLTWETVDNGADVKYTEPLEDVNISFSCIKYQCEYGQSSFNYALSGYQAGLIENFPYCVGGIMRGNKENYKEDWQRVVTANSEVVELNLIPTYTIPASKLKIIKHEFDSEGIFSSKDITGDELALIRMKNYKINEAGVSEVFHEIFQPVGGLIETEVLDSVDIEFLGKANFQYATEINLFDDDQIIGGYKGNWTPSWSQLEGAEEIIFHVLSREDASEKGVVDLVLNMEKYTGQFGIEPEIITGQTEES
jgi:hypothetical protein